MKSILIRSVCAVALAAALFAPAWALNQALTIEPARTRVGLARVHLEIADLQVRNSLLVGTYQIRVPLFPSKDDRGNIEIDLASPLDHVILNGGTLQGHGQSVLDGRTHEIRCAFGTENTVQIRVDTGDRILAFKTRFQ